MPAKAKSIRLDRQVDSMFQKTKMCKFFARGACARGSQCIFAHGHAELAPMPDFACTKICPALLRSGACGDMKCKFAHDHGQLRPRVADRVWDEAPPTEFSYTTVHSTQEPAALTSGDSARRRRSPGAAQQQQEQQQPVVEAVSDNCSKPTQAKGSKGCWSRQTTAESAAGGQQVPEDDDDDFSDISDDDEEVLACGELVGLQDLPSDLASNLTEDEVPAGLEEISSMEDDHPVMFQVCVTNTFISLVEDAPRIAVRKVASAPDVCALMSQEEEEELNEASVLSSASAEPSKEEGEQPYSSESTVLTAGVVSDSDLSERCSVRALGDAWVPEAVVKNTFLNFADVDETDDTQRISVRKVASAPGVLTMM